MLSWRRWRKDEKILRKTSREPFPDAVSQHRAEIRTHIHAYTHTVSRLALTFGSEFNKSFGHVVLAEQYWKKKKKISKQNFPRENLPKGQQQLTRPKSLCVKRSQKRRRENTVKLGDVNDCAKSPTRANEEKEKRKSYVEKSLFLLCCYIFVFFIELTSVTLGADIICV